MPGPVDRRLLRSRLQKACEAAVHDARTFPCDETLLRAAGKLDGLLHGTAAVLMSLRLGDADPSLLEEARAIVGRYRQEVSNLLEPGEDSEDEEKG